MKSDSIIKQVIVMRTKYPDGKGGYFKPRTGKLIAQGAHASMMFLADQMRQCEVIEMNADIPVYSPKNPVYLTEEMKQWLEGKFTKICLGVETEEELDALYSESKIMGLHVKLVIDSGMTEFHGKPTKTCIAIGPDLAEKIDEITGHLKLI